MAQKWSEVSNASTPADDDFGLMVQGGVSKTFTFTALRSYLNTYFAAVGSSGVSEAPTDGSKYVRQNSGWVVESTGTGEANTASNVGTGLGKVFKAKSSLDLQFKSIAAGTDITVTNGTDDVTIAVTGGKGETNTGSNLGAGLNVFKQKTGVDFEHRSLVAGFGVTGTQGTNDITFKTANAQSALTDAVTIAIDFSNGPDFGVTLAGNRTLGSPSNQEAGQSGAIYITQDATGSRTLSLHADWNPEDATAPVLSTAANAVDLLVYHVKAANSISCRLVKNVG